MGALAHYLEDEGLATTQISLIREHTAIIQPPRALWVPFELGRPLGVPNDAEFQSRVLLSALRLFESPVGPILEDFPEDAPVRSTDGGPVFCPVSFPLPEGNKSPLEMVLRAFQQEVVQMRNWYDLAVEKRQRTTAGASSLGIEDAVSRIDAFVRGNLQSSPMEGISGAMALKMAAEEIKAYYFEAVTAQPGQPTDSATLADWFWGRTKAGQVINAAREICLKSEENELKLLGTLLLVPRDQLHRFTSGR